MSAQTINFSSLKDLLHTSLTTTFTEEKWFKLLTQVENKSDSALPIYFIAPQLPHPCELEIWNEACSRLERKSQIITNINQKSYFDQFVTLCESTYTPVHLSAVYCEGVKEDPTFLAGLDTHLSNASLIIAVGETSLATYQALKIKRKTQARLIVWQNAPRPNLQLSKTDLTNESAMRREVLQGCDSILCFDKDGSTWAYLENVNAPRIRKVSRGIHLQRFSQQMHAQRRIQMRSQLGLPEADFIFLHLGPLEIESGALDTLYAFKSLVQSHPDWLHHTKLAFCGTGSAGAIVRQNVVQLDLDDHVIFVNPNDSSTLQILGNQLSNLLHICDAVIHNPMAMINNLPHKNLDSTYDVLCAIASGIPVISNGSGWAGEWVSRFFKTFACGNIHSLAKSMRDTIEKQDKIANVIKAARTTLENELSLDKAASEIQKLLLTIKNPQNATKTSQLTEMLTQIEHAISSKKFTDAIEIISLAFQHKECENSHKAVLLRYIADCFTKLGDLDSGQQNYLLSLELDAHCAKTYIGLGTVSLQRQQYHIAIPQFQKAVSLSPQDAMANLGLSFAFEGIQEWKEGLRWALRAAEFSPEETVTLYQVVKMSSCLEQYDDAIRVVTKYLKNHPHDVNMIFTLGGIAFATGQYAQAQDLMHNILVLDPQNERAHSLLNLIQRRRAAHG